MLEPELAVFANEAADIATSGRWNALNEVIERVAANPRPDDAWLVQVLAALCAAIFSEYLHLKRCYGEPKETTSTLAWRARNLLELSVWSEYCAKSRQDARRLYEDAGRDVTGIITAFEEWGTATQQSDDWLKSGTAAKQQLLMRAASEGIADLDGSYMAVHEAARKCGLKEHFRVGFKVLSKFAHPTAMQILAPPDAVRDARQKDVFFSKGCLFFTGAFAALERQLNQL